MSTITKVQLEVCKRHLFFFFQHLLLRNTSLETWGECGGVGSEEKIQLPIPAPLQCVAQTAASPPPSPEKKKRGIESSDNSCRTILATAKHCHPRATITCMHLRSLRKTLNPSKNCARNSAVHTVGLLIRIYLTKGPNSWNKINEKQ